MFPIWKVGKERIMLWLYSAMFKWLSLVKLIQSPSSGQEIKGRIRETGAISDRSPAGEMNRE